MLTSTLTRLQEPRLRNIALMGKQRITLHREILLQKKMIRQVFEEFYAKCVALEARHFGGVTAGARIELGAGTSLFKKLHPDVISTDFEADPLLDAVVDAQRMPFEDASVKTLFCINCFHHFPDPAQFFAEALRVLRPGGGCVIIDPAYGAFSDFLYKRLFSVEGYDRGAKDWAYLRGPDGGSLPNQALSYVVFFRDRPEFQKRFPRLKVVDADVMTNFVRYLISGGLNFRQLAPNWAIPALRFVERLISHLRVQLGLHHYIVLKKDAA